MLTAIIISLMINIIFMFMYAIEKDKRTNLTEYLKTWFEDNQEKLDSYETSDMYAIEWLQTETDTLEIILQELKK